MSSPTELPKQAVLHAQRDTRTIQPGRTVQQAVISHAQADMSPLPSGAAGPTERGFFGRLAERVAHAWNELHLGEEHAKSMLKLGGHELTQALAALPDSNVRPLEEPGVFGNEHMPHIQNHNHASRGQDKDHSPTR